MGGDDFFCRQNLHAMSAEKKVLDYLNKAIAKRLHQGGDCHCPICNYRGDGWFAVGLDLPVLCEKRIVGAGLRYAGCYGCLATDRERLVYLYLRDEYRLFHPTASANILHIAPEKTISKAIMSHGQHQYTAGDLFTEGYKYPHYVRNMNVLHLDFAADSFDLVICNHVLEHIENDRQAMSELYRVLKPGGTAILQVPISLKILETYEDFTIKTAQAREAAFGQFDHVRIYGQDYTSRLESVGFEVNRVYMAAKYPEHGLNPEEELFICRKKR